MSMYRLMHGVSQATFYILPLLGKHPEEYPRFRDCFTNDAGHPEHDGNILVYTRVGGGNREAHQEAIDELRAMPRYVTDYDDSHDSTYAMFVFEVPEEFKDDYDKVVSGRLVETSQAYRDRLCEVYPKLEEKFRLLFSALPPVAPPEAP